MKNNYLYIILFLWCGFLSGDATNSPDTFTERSRSEGGACKAVDVKSSMNNVWRKTPLTNATTREQFSLHRPQGDIWYETILIG